MSLNPPTYNHTHADSELTPCPLCALRLLLLRGDDPTVLDRAVRASLVAEQHKPEIRLSHAWDS